MAYRSSHYRRGYYRRTPSGGYTWVSPTIVSGYVYTPGSPTYLGRVPNITYFDNEKPLPDHRVTNNPTTIEKICELFQTLDSDERKYCLDLLEFIDIKLDEELSNTVADESVSKDEQNIVESDPALFTTEQYEDGLCITGFVGFDEKEINIPASIEGKPILALGRRAFSHVTSVNTVSMPNTIISIGSDCFSLCSNLQKVKLSNMLRVIGDEAFSATKIESIELPDSVISIGKGCFRESPIKSIRLSTSLTRISAYSFYQCTQLTTITIPEKVRTIAEDAFSGCVSLHSVTLPGGLETIEHEAFRNCSAIKTIDIPPSVNTIEPSAFYANGYRWLDIVIKCCPGSAAQKYARERGIKATASQITYKNIKEENPVSVCRIGYNNDLLPLNSDKELTERGIILILGSRPRDLFKIDSISYCFTVPASSLGDKEIKALEQKVRRFDFDLEFSFI